MSVSFICPIIRCHKELNCKFSFAIIPSSLQALRQGKISMVYWGNQQSKVILNLLSACHGAALFSYSLPKTMKVNDSAVILVPSLSIGDLELYS